MSDGYDARITSSEMEGSSHGLLVAVLMAHGGSIALPPSAFEPDAMGDAEGRLYGVGMEPNDTGGVRLMVINHHGGPVTPNTEEEQG